MTLNWGGEDFAAAAALLVSTSLAIAFILRFVHGKVLRPILLGGVIVFVLAIWAHLAVGIMT